MSAKVFLGTFLFTKRYEEKEEEKERKKERKKLKKALKILISTLSGLVIFVIILPILLSVLLQVNTIQNYVVDQISEKLSEVAHARISIGHVDIGFFNRAELDDVLMEDYRGDTMIFAGRVAVGINGINFLTGKISLGTVTVSRAVVNLYKDSTGVMNIQQVFANFKPAEVNPNPPNFRLTAGELNLLDTRFTLTEFNAPSKEFGVNYKNMRISDINMQARGVSVFNYNIWLSMEHLDLKEASGLTVEHFSSNRCGVDSSGMYYADVRLESMGSALDLDSMNFLTANRSWYDWNDFENKMILSAIIDEAKISTNTLKYVAGLRIARPLTLRVNSGTLHGAVSAMSGQINGVGFDGTSADMEYSIRGLPAIDSTRFDLRLTELRTSGTDVARAYSCFTGQELKQELIEMITQAGELRATGHFDGLLKDFKSSVTLKVGQRGVVDGSLAIKPTADDRFSMVASTVVRGVEAGRILGVEKMGSLSLSAQMSAKMGGGRKIELRTKAEIQSLGYGTYNFNSILVDGTIQPSGFVGVVSSTDPNLTFRASGSIDLSNENKPDYDFDMNLARADFSAMGLNTRDSISMLSAHFAARAVGQTIDDVNGEATIGNIIYVNHLDTIRTGRIYIESQNTPQLKELKLFSDFADMDLRGRNSFSEIFRYFSNSLKRFLPSFPDVSQIVTGEKQTLGQGTNLAEVPFADGYYQLRIKVKQANNVAGIFVPGLEVAQGSDLNFFFNPYLDQFSLRASSNLIEMKDLLIENMELDSRNHNDSLSMFLTADYLRAGGIGMPEFSIIGGIKNNEITLGGRFTDSLSKSSVLLRTKTTFTRTESGMAQMQVALYSTPLSVQGKQWNLSPATILLDTTGVQINDFALTHGNQRLKVNGHFGRLSSDTLRVEMQQFDMSPASALISSLGYRLSGTVGGDVMLVSGASSPRLFAALDFQDIYLNNYSLGNPKLRSTFDRENKRINFALGDDLLKPPVKGFYDLQAKQWGGQIKFPSFDMVLIEPLLSGILTQTSGVANVDLELRGKGELPNLSGEIMIESYSAMVDYTKARYNLAGKVRVRDNSFYLDATPISDGAQGTGTITAKLETKYFKNLRFDIQAQFADLLALNTTIQDNTSFYGKAYGTGRLSITGNESKTNIEIMAATALQSRFVLPLSTASTIEAADFIRFVDRSRPAAQSASTARTRRAKVVSDKANELDLKIGLQVLPNTLAQIEFDAKIGDVIKARGEGNLMLHINPTQGIFTMNGPVEVTQGEYLFTMLTIFQRHFVINPGATMQWTGDPANPQIDLSAIYKVKTSLEPLDMQSGQTATANIDCSIVLSGSLVSPEIKFAITAPSADPETQNLLRNSLNTQEALTMQFLALLLGNSFIPDMGASAIGTMSESFVGVTGSEFLFNQLSQLISTEKVKIRFGYRPQTTASSDEVYAGVGGDIIQDVLSFEVDGNYNTGNNTSINQRNPFTIDAYLTWNINKKRTLKLKGFTRTVDRFDETQGLQESGVGVYFRQDFQDIPDLKKRLDKNFKIEKVKKADKATKRTKN